MSKVRCVACGDVNMLNIWIECRIPHPKLDERPIDILQCPECGWPEDFVVLCDQPGCEKEVVSGTPTPEGYRQTCAKHIPPVGRRRG